MKVISESVIKSNTGKTFAVKKGQIIRVTGESTADYVVFNLHNVKERFDQARTKVDQGKIYVTTGDVLIFLPVMLYTSSLLIRSSCSGSG